MGTAIGIVLVATTIVSLVAFNIRASRMSSRPGHADAGWVIDPQTGQRVQRHGPADPGPQGDGSFGGGGGGHHG